MKMLAAAACAAGAAALAVGCRSSAPLVTSDETRAPANHDSDLTVEVVSHAFRDAQVYLRLGGSRQRLGLAGGNRTSTFTVPWNAHLANTVEASLLADQIGDDTSLVSSELSIYAGARIVWTISGQFYQTGLDVY
jgi:hypothetical protein